MAYRLIGVEPLPETLLTCSQLDPKEQDSVKFDSEYNNFHFKKNEFGNVVCKMAAFFRDLSVSILQNAVPQSVIKPNLVAKILATKFGVFMIYIMLW